MDRGEAVGDVELDDDRLGHMRRGVRRHRAALTKPVSKRADRQLADKLLVQCSLNRLQPSLRSMNEPVPARAFGDREDHVMRRGFPLAMDAVMPQRRDRQAKSGRELTFVRPDGQTERWSCSTSVSQVAHVPVAGAHRLREEPIGFVASQDLGLLARPRPCGSWASIWVSAADAGRGWPGASSRLQRLAGGLDDFLTGRGVAAHGFRGQLRNIADDVGRGVNKDLSQSEIPREPHPVKVRPGRSSGPDVPARGCTTCDALDSWLPTLRTWEPWRREPRNAPPRRNTVAILAGCGSAGPEHPGQTQSAGR